MTSANIVNVSSNTYANGVENTARSQQKKTEEMAGLFGSMMNQFGSDPSNAGGIGNDIGSMPKASDAGDGKGNLADSVSYADPDRRVTKAPEETSISEKVDSAKEELGGFEEEVVAAISEKLGVSGEEVLDMLDQLGLSAFDLLNPQNLGALVMNLTGMEDSAQLLLNTDFQDLMSQIGQMGGELMNRLDLQMNQMDDLIREMDILEVPEESGEIDPELLTAVQEQAPVSGQEEAVQTQASEEPVAEDTAEDAVYVQTAVTEAEGEPEDSNGAFSFEGESDQRGFTDGTEHRTVSHETAAAGNFQPEQMIAAEAPVDVAAAEDSYLSVDSMELIQQVVENVRTATQNNATTIEMQLNPANLGRVYLNLTSREGSVSAQFTATSEAVRAALEAQIADLRENLNQAGVKVDAIEVTVASHEFEENLEQNAHREEQQGEQQERGRGRRSLRLDSLDELSGLMTEEEVLAAQIMRDNGNSMDMKA